MLLVHGIISIHAPRVGSDHSSRLSNSRLSYFNPRSPCGERLRGLDRRSDDGVISIHAPRVGSDHNIRLVGIVSLISIHAPRVGSDGSTTRRARQTSNFNPRSPCGERPNALAG